MGTVVSSQGRGTIMIGIFCNALRRIGRST